MKKKIFLGFSVMEIIISFTVIAIIASTTAPIFLKKSQSIAKHNITNSLRSGDNTDGISGCRVSFKGQCLFCESGCNLNQYQIKETCSCTDCSSVAAYGAACQSCTKTHCRYCSVGYGYYKGVNITGSVVPDKYRGSCIPNSETHPACIVKPQGVIWNTYPNPHPCYGECPKGYYSNGKVPCQVCPFGQFQKNARQAVCTNCTSGHKCPGYGNWEETNCGGGYYQPSAGQTSCLNCGAGYYCPGPADTNHTPCGIGYYCPGPVDTTPTKCPSGATTTTTTATNITQCVCAANSYKVNYNPSTGSFDSCQVCPDGYYCNGTNKYPCGKGVYCPGDGNTSPKQCPAGYYCGDGPNGSSIPKCPCGKYSDAPGASACKDAPVGYYTPAINGLYTSAVICPKGHYCNDRCNKNPCPTWGYQDKEGKTTCLDCNGVGINYTTASVGATSKSKCTCNTSGGYATTSTGACCKKVTQATINEKCPESKGAYFKHPDFGGCYGICIQKSNQKASSGARIYTAGKDEKGSYSSKPSSYCWSKPCCWTGTTASNGGVSGQGKTTRPVCNWWGARKTCTGDWRLPTEAELKKYFYYNNKDNILNLCYENYGPGHGDCKTSCSRPQNVPTCSITDGCYGGQTVANSGQKDVCATHEYWGAGYEKFMCKAVKMEHEEIAFGKSEELTPRKSKSFEIEIGSYIEADDSEYVLQNLDTIKGLGKIDPGKHVENTTAGAMIRRYPASVRCVRDIVQED